MTSLTGHTPDSLFGVRRDVGRAARIVAQVGMPWFSPGDRFRLGALAVPLDINLGLEVYRLHRPEGVTVVTSELSIDFTGVRVPLGGTIIVEGKAMSATDTAALSTSRAMDEAGNVLATATSSTRFVTLSGPPAVLARDPMEFPAPNRRFDDLLGATPIRRDGALTLDAVSVAELTNARFTLQGGFSAALAEWAGSELLDDHSWLCQSVRAAFLRPVPMNARFTVHAEPRREGRGFALIDVTIESGGEVCVLIRAGYRREQANTTPVSRTSPSSHAP